MELTLQELSLKNGTNGEPAYILIDNSIYDISKFALIHPGGQQVILDFAGKDATDQFYSLHRHSVIQKYQRLKVASLKHASPKIINTQFVDYSLVPFAEHPSLRFKYSPYYSDKHQQYRSIVRKFVADHVLEDALSCEESGKRPSKELVKLLGKEGYLAARLGPGKHLEGLKLPGNILPQEFDYFYEQITHEEYVRCMCRGYVDGFGGGMTIGLPPVFNYGKKELKERVMKEVLSGEKEICLAISEAFAGTFIITLGSDVSGIRTFAKKSADGSHFIVNGSKKWITGGMYADYFSTACKTEKGMTMLLIERGPGVETTPIKTSYSATAGTAYVVFENVKVPISNVLGVEDKGFAVVMANFNHERWAMCVGINRSSRMIIEECFKWANQRKVFGKNLLSQPVIRQKLAEMVSLNESMTQWVDFTTYQMNHHTYKEQSLKLAGQIALLKYKCTRAAHVISDHAVQIFGGRGITRTGMGRVIEMFQRTYKFDAILGGSEEILADLGIKQAIKRFPNARL